MSHVEQTLDALRQRYGDVPTQVMNGHVSALVPADKIVDAVAFLLNPDGGFTQVMDVTAVDYYTTTPRFEVVYQLLSHPHRCRLSLRVGVPDVDGVPTVPSITGAFPGANWFERETYDMFGIRFDGHPDLRRILMPHNYAAYPLRRDFPLGYEEVAFSHNAHEIHSRKPFTPQGLARAAEIKAVQPSALVGADAPPDPTYKDSWKQPIEPTGGMRQHVGLTLDDASTIGPLAVSSQTAESQDDPFGETMVMNIGPQHPATHGVLRLVTELNGERLVRVMPDIGFLHTGIEKTMESKSYLKALTCTDRTGYAAPLHCNMAFSGTVEKLLDVDVPLKAQYARVILLELDRISSHLLFAGSSAMDLGASSPFLWAIDARERVYDIMELVSGQRMMTSYIRPGGLAYDLPQGFDRAVQAYLDYIPGRVDQIEEILISNPIFLDRTQKVGVLSKEDAMRWSVSGPIARSSGVDWDLRRDMPYLVYDQFQFNVLVRTEGDTYARFLLRLQEIRESVKIAQQALDAMPPGRWMTANRKVAPPPKEEIAISMESLIHHFKLWTEGFRTPPGQAYFAVESPRGEMGFFMHSDGSAKPYRCHQRSGAFAALQSMPLVVTGMLISDLIAIIASWDPILGEIDR